jgi:Zn-dependent protease with chaperone function
MIAAFALLLGVLLVAWFAPPVLGRLIERGVDPQVVLVTWGVLVGATFLTAAATLVVVVLPMHEPLPSLMQFVHHCWAAMRHGRVPEPHDLPGLLILVVLVAVSTLAVRGLVRYKRSQRQLHRRHWELLRVAAQPEEGRYPTMWLSHDDPLAYSVAGEPPFVVATRGIRERLSAADAAAVIEHERAHLRGRHHLLVGVADALAGSAPWLPLMRQSPTLIRTVVELAADRAAARAHGPGAVRSALLIMSRGGHGGTAPQPALGMAETCVTLRLQQLDGSGAGPGRFKRALASGIAALAAVALPGLTGAALMVGFATLTCPMWFGG